MATAYRAFSVCGFVFLAALAVSIPSNLRADEESDVDAQLWETDADIRDSYESGDIDFSTYDTLLKLYDDKVDLNLADIDTIRTLPGVTLNEAEAIIKSRGQKPFAETEDLIKRNIIDESRYDQIRLFITVTEPAKKKIIVPSGDVYFRTSAKVEDNVDNYLPDDIYSPTRETFRYRLRNLGRYGAGFTVLRDEFFTNFRVAASSTVTDIEKHNTVRLRKYYLGWSASTDSKSILRSYYLGSYRGVLGQGVTFGGSAATLQKEGFYPDDSYATTRKNLYGIGVELSYKKLRLLPFYSDEKYPASATLVYNLPDETQKSKSVTVDDVYRETLRGFGASYQFSAKTSAGYAYYGAYWRPLIGNITLKYHPTEDNYAADGVNFRTSAGGLSLWAEFSRVFGYGAAYYLKLNQKIGPRTSFVFTYDDADPQFYNPWSRLSTPGRERFSYQLQHRLLNTNLRYKLTQTKSPSSGQNKVNLSHSLYARHPFTKSTVLTVSKRFAETNSGGLTILEDIVFTKGTPQALSDSTSLSVLHNLKRFQIAYTYKLSDSSINKPTSFKTSDSSSLRIGYKIEPVQIRWQMTLSDTNIDTPQTESFRYNFQINTKLGSGADAVLRFGRSTTLKYTDETQDDGSMVQTLAPGVSTTMDLRINVKFGAAAKKKHGSHGSRAARSGSGENVPDDPDRESPGGHGGH